MVVVVAHSDGAVKTVHLVRHAQAESNAAFEVVGREAYHDEQYADARLTLKGREQARRLGTHHAQALLQVELVVCSPLSRTIETTLIAYEAAYAQAALAAPQAPARQPRLLLLEQCREKIGFNPCDRRSSRTEILEMFGERLHAAFAEVSDELHGERDELWTREHRETADEIQARASSFVGWMMDRPERSMMCVTHSAFLSAGIGRQMLENHKQAFTAESQMRLDAEHSEMTRWYENCDMRTFTFARSEL
ncbi:Phosphoglycerate mutase-like protein [Porphyridium purpureum]|uniref:Phosphoglycerate mutase-like protein n=1 Tax=Porphyridium purpureum TaxID=35688 RepID=A0A5J4YQG0_PORPP|nr:Phosphoglycerate mutase-like protein [Porphyridium purpureum]|eukprot:POR9632..scf236_6